MQNRKHRALAGALAVLGCTACGGTLEKTHPTNDTAARQAHARRRYQAW